MPVDLGEGLTLPNATKVLRYRTVQPWEAARIHYLGASEVAKVLGLSPYGGQWSVIARKLGYDPPRTSAQARGHKWERRILEDYAEATGHRVVGPLGPLSIRNEGPIAVTLDSFVLDPNAGWGIGEAKTDADYRYRYGASGTVIESWTPEAAEVIREDYAAQIYAQLAVTGLPWAALIVRRSLDDFRWFYLMADPVIQRIIVDTCTEWWQRIMVQGHRPEVDDTKGCTQAMDRIFPKGQGYLTGEDTDVEALRYLIGLREHENTTKAERRLLQNKLAARIGGHRGINLPRGCDLGRRATLVRSAGRSPYLRVA